ncbi:MAG: acyl carrier protein [Sandaracinaceae bacterium]
MTAAELEHRLAALLASVLERPVGPGEPIERGREAAWTSLRHVELLFSLEETFDVRFTEAELMTLESSGAIRDALLRRARDPSDGA